MNRIIKKMMMPLRYFVQFLITPYHVKAHNMMPPYKSHFVLLYEERLLQTSVDYAVKHFRQSLYFHFTFELWDYTMNRLRKSEAFNSTDLLLEFGTWQGTSINYFSSRIPEKTFFGFDSFEGLKEDWTGFSLPAGYFDLKGQLPKVNANVKLVKGWFDQSLPGFLEKNPAKILFLHIDCDTYESTLYVLNTVKERLHKGTYILFDEYIGYPNWEFGEYKAFQEFVSANNIQYKYISFSVKQVLIEIQ